MSADAIVNTALAQEGLSYGADRMPYLALCYAGDTAQDAAEMGRRQSSCGLVARGILRIAEVDGGLIWQGVAVDVLRDPYARLMQHGCYAITLLETLGRDRQLWVPAREGGDPQPGDIIVIGADTPGWGGGEHVLTCVDRDGDLVESIDGGQTDPANGGHSTAVRKRQRTLVRVPGTEELWLASAPQLAEGRPVNGRRIQGWLRAGELPCVAGLPYVFRTRPAV